MHLYNSLLK